MTTGALAAICATVQIGFIRTPDPVGAMGRQHAAFTFWVTKAAAALLVTCTCIPIGDQAYISCTRAARTIMGTDAHLAV